MSNSVQPHRQQPTRLHHPWDSLGKNTGVGCHFLLQCMKVKSESEVAQLCPILSDPMDCSLPRSSVHGIFQARVLEWVAIAFSIPMLKSSTTQEPISSRARHTMQILQQRRNIALSVNIRAAQSHTKHIDPSQNSLLGTPLHSREKKSSSTHQNTDASFPNQETLTNQSSNPTLWVKPPQ